MYKDCKWSICHCRHVRLCNLYHWSWFASGGPTAVHLWFTYQNSGEVTLVAQLSRLWAILVVRLGHDFRLNDAIVFFPVNKTLNDVNLLVTFPVNDVPVIIVVAVVADNRSDAHSIGTLEVHVSLELIGRYQLGLDRNHRTWDTLWTRYQMNGLTYFMVILLFLGWLKVWPIRFQKFILWILLDFRSTTLHPYDFDWSSVGGH